MRQQNKDLHSRTTLKIKSGRKILGFKTENSPFSVVFKGPKEDGAFAALLLGFSLRSLATDGRRERHRNAIQLKDRHHAGATHSPTI